MQVSYPSYLDKYVIISHNNSSNCVIGGCYQDVYGIIYLAKIVNCELKNNNIFFLKMYNSIGQSGNCFQSPAQ